MKRHRCRHDSRLVFHYGTQHLSLISGRPANLGSNILIEDAHIQPHIHSHSHGTIIEASTCWKNMLKPSQNRCLGAEPSLLDICSSSSSGEATAASLFPRQDRVGAKGMVH